MDYWFLNNNNDLFSKYGNINLVDLHDPWWCHVCCFKTLTIIKYLFVQPYCKCVILSSSKSSKAWQILWSFWTEVLAVNANLPTG